MIGLGAQDDFARAQNFIASTGTVTPTMLWDPGFSTWQGFGVRINSQMMLMSSDLGRGTELFFGFGTDQQQAILDLLAQLDA